MAGKSRKAWLWAASSSSVIGLFSWKQVLLFWKKSPPEGDVQQHSCFWGFLLSPESWPMPGALRPGHSLLSGVCLGLPLQLKLAGSNRFVSIFKILYKVKILLIYVFFNPGRLSNSCGAILIYFFSFSLISFDSCGGRGISREEREKNNINTKEHFLLRVGG